MNKITLIEWFASAPFEGLTYEAECLAVRLLFVVDSDGRGLYDTTYLRPRLYPRAGDGAEANLAAAFAELIKCKLVSVYEVSGIQYFVLNYYKLLTKSNAARFPSPPKADLKSTELVKEKNQESIIYPGINPTSSPDYTENQHIRNVENASSGIQNESEVAGTNLKNHLNANAIALAAVDPSETTEVSLGAQMLESESADRTSGTDIGNPEIAHAESSPLTDDHYPTKEELAKLAPAFPVVKEYARTLGAGTLWSQKWYINQMKSKWSKYTVNQLKNWPNVVKNDYDVFCKNGRIMSP